MAYACNCKGIPERTVKQALAEKDGPVIHKEFHRELAGDSGNCCGGCHKEDGNRTFVDMVNKHNEEKTNENSTATPKLFVPA